MAIWDDVISKQEQEVLRKTGFGTRREFGKRPALAVIDVLYNFVGDKPEPLIKSIERFPLSCGQIGWQAVNQIASILPLVRDKKVPIVYSMGDPSLPSPWESSHRGLGVGKGENGNEIVREVTPESGDIIIKKVAPSIFFGTPLVAILLSLKVDTVVCCGGVTSGCVRASVVDAASYGFNVGVIEECTFDRSQVSHKVNLFDMDLKYAQVISVDFFKEYLGKIAKL